MAKLHITGIDEAMSDVAALKFSDGELNSILIAGAKEAKQAQIRAIQKQGLVDTGDMANSVDYATPKKTSNGREIEIYPKGKDRKGVRNAEKLFVLHYGTSSIHATHVVDDADSMASKPVLEAMEAERDRILKRKGI